MYLSSLGYGERDGHLRPTLHPPYVYRQAKRQATTLAFMRHRGILTVVDTWLMHVVDDKRRRLFEGAVDDGTAVTDGRAVMVHGHAGWGRGSARPTPMLDLRG